LIELLARKHNKELKYVKGMEDLLRKFDEQTSKRLHEITSNNKNATTNNKTSNFYNKKAKSANSSSSEIQRVEQFNSIVKVSNTFLHNLKNYTPLLNKHSLLSFLTIE
jgi:hypothetical protein